MMERRRRQAAVRLQQHRRVEEEQPPVSLSSSSSSSASSSSTSSTSRRTTDERSNHQNNKSQNNTNATSNQGPESSQRGSNGNGSHNQGPTLNGNTGSLRMRKRDLLAKSRRSLSEPHRRFSSPPALLSAASSNLKPAPKRGTSSPRGTKMPTDGPLLPVLPSNTNQKNDSKAKPINDGDCCDGSIHAKDEARALFAAIPDQRERRMFLKSKAKQLVLSKQRAAHTPPTSAPSDSAVAATTAAPVGAHNPSNNPFTSSASSMPTNKSVVDVIIPTILVSPRRFAERRKKSDQLHSSMAKTVLAQRKKHPAAQQNQDTTTLDTSIHTPVINSIIPATSCDNNTPLTKAQILPVQDESTSHTTYPADAAAKKFLLRHHKLVSIVKGGTRLEPTSSSNKNQISEAPKETKNAERNVTHNETKSKYEVAPPPQQRQPILVVKAAKESFSAAKAVVETKKVSMDRTPSAGSTTTPPELKMNKKTSAEIKEQSSNDQLLTSTKMIESFVADKGQTSFLHQKAARHKQQRDLRRKSAPYSDTTMLITDELTAILDVPVDASDQDTKSPQRLSSPTFNSDGKKEMVRKRTNDNETAQEIHPDDARSCSMPKQKIDESMDNGEMEPFVHPISIEFQPIAVHAKQVRLLSNHRETKPSLLHRIRQEGVNEAIKQQQLSPRHNSPRNHAFDMERNGVTSPRNGSLSPLTKENEAHESPKLHVFSPQPLPSSPIQDRTKFIRADEYEYVHETVENETELVPTTFNTSLHVDKTVASRLDSPVKKMVAPFAMFDLIEIVSIDDEDRHAFDSVAVTQSLSVDRDDNEPIAEPPKSAPLRVDIGCCKESPVNSSPATEAAAIAYETPCTKVSENNVPSLSTSDSLDEFLATPKEMDFRPLPALESAIVESSWDANKVLFNEYNRPRDNTKEPSWTEQILPKDESTTPLIVPVVDDTMDPLGWPRSPLGLVEPNEMSFYEADDENLSCHNDDENLLQANVQGSADMEDEAYRSPTSKQERIQEYERTEHDEESSLEDDEDDSDDEEEVEIGYISQESETVDDIDNESYQPQRNPRVFFPDELAPAGSEDNPIQIPVVLDLTETDLQPTETLSADDLDSLLASTVGDALSPRSLLEGPMGRDNDDLELLPPPPPPPPPLGGKTNRVIPLLAPPPAEKFAQWEATHLNTTKDNIIHDAVAVTTVANRKQSLENGTSVLIERNHERDILDDTKNGKRRHKTIKGKKHHTNLLIFPKSGESPFDKAIKAESSILKHVLDFLGDPVAVCRTKMLSKSCQRFVRQNEHTLMRDAVRLGGINMNVRPYFWLWVTLEKAAQNDDDVRSNQLRSLEKDGRAGKWSHVIERDVSRAFGNLPPHKSGARLRTDSIVRALVSWGKSRVVNKGVRGSGDVPSRAEGYESDEISAAPTDTVSDWGGVTPVGSFGGSVGSSQSDNDERAPKLSNSKSRKHTLRADEMALSGNTLSEDMKITLQHKLSFILHALAALHGDVGYCQGMDYVVAHLLRILQDTIRWKAANGTLPSIVENKPRLFGQRPLSRKALQDMYAEVDRSLVVEETCFRVMNTFFTTYSLEHFYWPELRCLKTCCRVFEKLIQIKLPVLADHFEHHELNVGLFALGWFQTLFLYLPSMPSATVCHMWDIWLVERSFKIFFRVGTAILFLSQPILLNYELEGMMSYLNTFPDATLLSPDILIACALQIKVTNTMLMELEEDVKRTTLTC